MYFYAMNQFKNTIEVFDKIAKNVKSETIDVFGKRIEYVITEKQFNWLANVYIQEDKNWDSRFGVTVTDEQGTQYSFSYNKYMNNVPRYIPNQKSYGKKYYISKIIKIKK